MSATERTHRHRERLREKRAEQQRITEMLYQVKVSGAVPELMKALEDPAQRSVRRTILATFWNAGLDVRDQVEQLVAVAVEGDAEDLRTNEDVKEFYLGLSSSGRKSFKDVKHYRRRKRWLS